MSSYMGPYISNYILSELELDKKIRHEGNYIIHIFPRDVQDKPWVKLFEEIDAKVFFIDYKPRTLGSILCLRRIFKQENINIIHCQFGGWDFDAKFAAPFTKMIWHQRMSVNLDTWSRKIKYWLKYNLLGFCRTRHIGISEAVYNAIDSLTLHKVYLIPNAIDFKRLDVSEAQKKAHDEKGPYKLLMFSYSPYVKGLDIAYRACDFLNAKGVNVELAVVSQENSDVEIYSTYNPMPHWMRILKPNSNVSEYYLEADAFLSASRSEGFSNSLLEAIYSGLNVIYSDISGTRWASEFRNAFMYSVESPQDLANAIILSMNSSISEENVVANRKLAEEKYSMLEWVNSIYSIYEDYC